MNIEDFSSYEISLLRNALKGHLQDQWVKLAHVKNPDAPEITEYMNLKRLAYKLQDAAEAMQG